MKGQIIISTILICLLGVVAPSPAQTDGPYELTWSTIDAGGGQSSGGTYVLTGTIGQPDAAYSAGGKYELLGGFLPGGPLCIAEFDDFAKLAEQWLNTASGLTGDLDGDNDVDFDDLSWLADFWLCNCPAPWPLKRWSEPAE
jgi:hypothetical protein